MHPAYSVILFTTASGAGYGLLATLGICALFGLELPQTFWFAFAAMAVSLGLVTVGLLSSTFHLGHPERAWRAFSQWRSSWLSREGVAAVATYFPAGLFGLVWLFIDEPTWIWQVLGGLSAVGAIATVWCTGMIYGCLTTIRQWNQPLVAPVYIAMAAATGLVLFAMLMAIFGTAHEWHGIIAATGVVTALVLKGFYWQAIDNARRDLTIGDATGLGKFGTVRQTEAPHTQANFVQREMGYRVARKHAFKLRKICLYVGFFLSWACCVLASYGGKGFEIPLLITATLTIAIGAILERWLFFAEAEHVVNLFYGTRKA